MQAPNLREEGGRAIAVLGNQIHRVDAHAYRARSQSGNGDYDVLETELGWVCACPDHIYRGVKCKHIYAVEFSAALRQAVAVTRIAPIADVNRCVYCEAPQIVRDGIRQNKHGAIQKWACKACGRYFTLNLGFAKMKHDPQGITAAMQLYFSGESLRNAAKSLRLLGMQVSHLTVYKWIRKYVRLMESYVEGLRPQVSGVWRADELWVKIRGNQKYLFALMDDETRFWIAQQVADNKQTADVRPLFRRGKELTGMKPTTLITDGLYSFRHACRKEFWGRKRKGVTQHIRHIRLQGDRHNNKMERLNGEVRDREKVMRGLKKCDSAILAGYQLFHNYIRPHEGLDGKTPAEAAGIQVEGPNKWLTLIQHASRPTKVNSPTNPSQS